MVYVFNIPGVEQKLCMSKTPFNKIFKAKDKSADFMTGAKTMTYEGLRKEDKGNEENEESEEDEEKSKKKSMESKKKSKESKKKQKKDRDSSDTEMGGYTENEGNDNRDKEYEEDNSENGDEDDENITPSIEQNVRERKRKLMRLEQSLDKTGSRNRRERHTSPGISGETPEPEPGMGGILIYAMEGICFGKKVRRGLLKREGSYVFERLTSCRSELILPEQSGGMAPLVDDEFVSGLQSTDRTEFNIVGCTAKWHGKPNKQIIVILEFEDENNNKLYELLEERRDEKGYNYKGPVVCKYKTFEKIMKPGDKEILQKFLDATEFGKSAPEEERAIDAKNCTNAQLMKKMEGIENILKAKL
ncbi:hypothetical protein ACJQWK_09922 [Exserohilum turcicum]